MLALNVCKLFAIENTAVRPLFGHFRRNNAPLTEKVISCLESIKLSYEIRCRFIFTCKFNLIYSISTYNNRLIIRYTRDISVGQINCINTRFFIIITVSLKVIYIRLWFLIIKLRSLLIPDLRSRKVYCRYDLLPC